MRARTRLLLTTGIWFWAAADTSAAPRMISYGYPSCVSCHLAPQGRGLLNSYGRGIDMAQSYSKKDFTAMLFGRKSGDDEADGNWDGRFGNVLLDFIVSMRLNQQFDRDKTDPTVAAVYRQAIFFTEGDRLRLDFEVGFVDGGLTTAQLGPDLVATGGDNIFLKKLLLEWRWTAESATSGHALALGRDYLPLGLQIDDHSTYILHLNRAGIYDYPLQLKYFVWNDKFLASVFAYGPSFDDDSSREEYGAGFLYERYPTNNLALGLQVAGGCSDESDRFRAGPYLRWGISEKWAVLGEADYGAFWNGSHGSQAGSQVTALLQVFHHHYEWLVSSVSLNYAYSDLLFSEEHLASFRYIGAARLNRNLTVGLTYQVGEVRRNLEYGQELAVFANLKF